uniref:H(+)-exporting diphosphatase n=1 Tax=Fibrocapsa japonica TaxID=94617 RepID=A0A7S2Y359_9STRA|mmetsp:Transcript_4297/g.6436  ORF Transcript_4297/g.6436 Transcript_4297/m.6436 type:complete len:731 (+) Transcript_4297:81-2273(+)|eukprot:CAMPEP_0113943908 /NCGR_PEP_ID=MMETSP1339-20121228/29409_1 /TAXON_ID=94617 /ORGANISM="Fibrocapsa japonica" /LENGTH=730 /DNA_ID=CAMNT_0000948909 /DNA_START=44 /DNA_END=2236 /DNA_ORIENTATION=+ /assembly_acc=CAM_ASM_000762
MALETCDYLIVACSLIGILFGIFQFALISSIKVSSQGGDQAALRTETEKLTTIYEAIRTGAQSFLMAEYTICAVFIVLFGAVVLLLISYGADSWVDGSLTCIAFVLGSITSIVCGYIGMMVAVFANARTTVSAQKPGWSDCFNVAFRAGGVMGFSLCGLGIIVLWVLLYFYKQHFDVSEWELMMDCVSGYGLGGSSIAMFGRVGGGIYTKAADVGADLVGKVVHGIPEDDPRNPATIADNVGDNVGDVAGMGADLFGSFAESTCAALVIGASTPGLVAGGWNAIMFPLVISSVGIIVCLVTSFLATNIMPVKKEEGVEFALKLQLIVTTILMIPAAFFTAEYFLPSEFEIVGVAATVTAGPIDAFVCVISGVIGGLIIGLITEYYTSHSYTPVREVAESCKTGAATNVIYGLALGYLSVIIPVFVLAAAIFTSFKLCDLYGVALTALGMLSTLATGLTIDAYGPVCDNAGGIAEMAELNPEVREKTDALDAAGNTTAAIGKGFAIGSAALVSLALYGAFVTRLGITTGVNILEPLTFAFLLIGAMLPFWFSALTMKSVGTAAMEMVLEVERQFKEKPHLLDKNSTERPDYDRCIKISTQASLKRMIAPGALVMLSPLIAGIFFGVYAVCGVLTGGLVSGVQMAISMSNTGGAWDNAKKYIEKAPSNSELKGKGSDIHKAAVIGDTVGDPLKDTSGPALNILMKLMAIISLVFADFFDHLNDGCGIFNIKT